MELNIFSKLSRKLNNHQIRSICLLKDTHWSFGIKEQIKWFKKNVKKDDIHNLFFLNSKLIGYTLLRKRSCFVNKSNKKIKYLYFDTLIINKKYKGKNLSNMMMNFNNIVIKESGYFSFLICKNKLISFYKKNRWTKLKKNQIKLLDHSFSTNGMVFNELKPKKKYKFCINS